MPASAKRRRKPLRFCSHANDAINRRLLEVLQANGRATNLMLARHADLSPPPTLRRVRILESVGVIRGYYGRLNPKSLGFNVTAFVIVGLKSFCSNDVGIFESEVATWHNVRECHELRSRGEFLLKCVFRELEGANFFVRAILLQTPNVATANTAFCVDTIKNEPRVPFALLEEAKDETMRFERGFVLGGSRSR